MASRPIWSSYDGDLLSDRGLFYGDGLFETILITQGRPRLLHLHLARLHRSAAALGIVVPDHLEKHIDAGLLQSGVREAVLKLVVSREASSRGYAADPTAGSNALLLLYKNDVVPSLVAPFVAATDTSTNHAAEPGVNVGLCATRLARQPLLAGHKHLNRLEQVIARGEWQRGGIAEGLMRDTKGLVIEGTSCNLFLVHRGVLSTPDLTYSGVAGVMREWVMREARSAGIEVREAEIQLADVAAADEMFLTNALMGIRPVANYLGPFPGTVVQSDHVAADKAPTIVKSFSVYTPDSLAYRFAAALSDVAVS